MLYKGNDMDPSNYERDYNNQMQLFIDSQFRAAVMLGDIDGMVHYLDKGADVNSRAPNGASVLFLAIRKSRYEVAEFLLKHGAACNDIVETEGSFAGYTPMHLACRENELKFAKLLVGTYNAKVNIRADDGSYPIHFAVFRENMDMVKMLLERGADVNTEYHRIIFKKVFTYKTWCDEEYKNYSLLAHATLQKNLALMGLLIDYGADVYLTDETKKVALLYAIEDQCSKVVSFLVYRLKEKVDIKTYMEKISIRNFKPIQFAALKGSSSIVEFLLEAGADPNMEFKRVHYTKYFGYKSWSSKYVSTISLLTHAKLRGNSKMASVLEKFGAKETEPISS